MQFILKILRKYGILLLFVAAKLILQYLLADPFYELHRDEFLHLDQARHIAFGFISIPPLTSIFSGIIYLAGGSVFWVKFFPALFGALTIVFAWLITGAVGGRLFSKVVVSSAILFSVYFRINILYQPNSFDILVWTIIFYLIIKFFETSENKWLWFLSFAVALGFNNKYNIVFLMAGLLAGLLMTRNRKLLLSLPFLKAAFLAFILVLPNLIWQFLHDFPVVDHMRVLKENQLDNNSPAGFLSSQLKIMAGSIPLLICAVYALFFSRSFRKYFYVALTFAVVLLLFTAFKAKDYYALGLFPVMFAFGAVWLEKIERATLRNALMSGVMLFNLVIFAAMVRFVMPVLSPEQIFRDHEKFEKMGLLRWEDGRNHSLPQDFADMTGWKEMAEKALRSFRTIPPAELDNTLVFCDNYGQAGALNYYNRGEMKEAYSFNTDYIFWLPRIDTIKNVILVGDRPDENILRMFNSCIMADSVTNIFARERGTGIFILKGADDNFTSFFYNEAERRKNDLDIF